MRKTTGLSLLLLIFLSLCLMTFALLSFSGAKADDTLSQKSADRTSQYYAADSAARRILAQIDEQLAVFLKESQLSENPQTAFLAAASQIPILLPDINWICGHDTTNTNNANADKAAFETTIISDTVSIVPDSPQLTFSVPVTDGQELVVTLAIQYPPDPQDTMYQIHSWNIQNTSDWNPDTTQNLYQMSPAS